MAILQLDPPLFLETPKGRAICHVLIDYGIEHHVLWGCFIEATGECWWWPNDKIRLTPNVSAGREKTSPIKGDEAEPASRLQDRSRLQRMFVRQAGTPDSWMG